MTDDVFDRLRRANPHPQPTSPPMSTADALAHVTGPKDPGRRTGRVIVLAAAAAAIAVIVFGALRVDNPPTPPAAEPNEEGLTDERRFSASAGRVELVSLGGLAFVTTEGATITQDPHHVLVTTESAGSVRIFRPDAAADGQALGPAADLGSQMGELGWANRVTDRATTSDRPTVRYEFTEPSASALFDVAVGEVTLSWRPAPGTELLAIDDDDGLILVSIEPPEPWTEPPTTWARALARSVELRP